MIGQATPDRLRPAIFLFVDPGAPAACVAELLFGIEEEGVASEVVDHRGPSAAALSRAAAEMSPLDVGIGATATQVALHHRELPAAEPLFAWRLDGLGAALLRVLGTNAARLVKGNPLIIDATCRPWQPTPG